MNTVDLHKRVKAIKQAAEKLMLELEAEMTNEAQQQESDAAHAAAVEQAKRELAAEKSTPVKG